MEMALELGGITKHALEGFPFPPPEASFFCSFHYSFPCYSPVGFLDYPFGLYPGIWPVSSSHSFKHLVEAPTDVRYLAERDRFCYAGTFADKEKGHEGQCLKDF